MGGKLAVGTIVPTWTCINHGWFFKHVKLCGEKPQQIVQVFCCCECDELGEELNRSHFEKGRVEIEGAQIVLFGDGPKQ